jgi:hypothetical protein
MRARADDLSVTADGVLVSALYRWFDAQCLPWGSGRRHRRVRCRVAGRFGGGNGALGTFRQISRSYFGCH